MAARRARKVIRGNPAFHEPSLDELYPLVRDSSVEETQRFLALSVASGVLSESEASSFARIWERLKLVSTPSKNLRENLTNLKRQSARFVELKRRQSEQRRAIASHNEAAYRENDAWKGFPLPSIADLELALVQAERRAAARSEKARRRADPAYRQRAIDLDTFSTITGRLWRNEGGRPPTVATVQVREVVSKLAVWIERQRKQVEHATSPKLQSVAVRNGAADLREGFSGDESTATIGEQMAVCFVNCLKKRRMPTRGIAIRMAAVFFEVSERTISRTLRA